MPAVSRSPSALPFPDRREARFLTHVQAKAVYSARGGNDAEHLIHAMADRKGLSNFKSRLGNARQEAVDMRHQMKALKVPDDATELDANLVTSLQEAVVGDDSMLKLTDLPDGFSDEQAAPLLEAMDATATKFDELTDELDQMQDACARKHRINLTHAESPAASERQFPQ